MSTEPEPAYKPQLNPEDKPSHFRTACIILATCTLLAGAGVHFSGLGGRLLGGTDTNTSPAADSKQQRIGVQMSLIAPEKAAQALASSGYSEKEQADILAGIKRRDLRLVAMPIFDATGTGGTVSVVCGTTHRTVALQPTPTVLILPITIAGNVDILPVSDPGVTGIGAGVVTLFGPQPLPVMHQGESLGLTVIAQ